jgi:hypothetical protein
MIYLSVQLVDIQMLYLYLHTRTRYCTVASTRTKSSTHTLSGKSKGSMRDWMRRLWYPKTDDVPVCQGVYLYLVHTRYSTGTAHVGNGLYRPLPGTAWWWVPV